MPFQCMDDKVIPLAEAIAKFVKDGDHIALGGWVIARCVVAAVHEIIRQRKCNLTVSQGVAGFDTDLLVGSGAVKHLNMSGGSLEDFGRLNRINKKILDREIDVEEYSALAMATRFLAGAMGLPYLPTRSLLGSTILENLQMKNPQVVIKDKCPFTGDSLVLLRALNPQTAIVHAQRADRDGNAQIFGPLWDTKEIVASADRVILTVDEIVEKSEIIHNAEMTVIPSFRVLSVSLVPFAAHPTSCYRLYDYDAQHLRVYAEASADDKTFKEYVKENILAKGSFEEYLESVCPMKRRELLKADWEKGY